MQVQLMASVRLRGGESEVECGDSEVRGKFGFRCVYRRIGVVSGGVVYRIGGLYLVSPTYQSRKTLSLASIPCCGFR